MSVEAEAVEAAPAAEEPSGRWVAILLALAAIVGVAIGGRASLVSSDASNGWQSAVRLEVKRAAATVEDVRFVYGSEAPIAFQVRAIRAREQNARRLARAEGDPVRTQLVLEAQALALFATNLSKGLTKGLTGPRYLTPKGGFDAERRLADQRRENPDLVAIDPEVAQRQGNRTSRQSFLEMTATIPAGIAFLLGAVAQAFLRPRRWLVLAGLGLVATAAVMGVVVEAAYA